MLADVGCQFIVLFFFKRFIVESGLLQLIGERFQQIVDDRRIVENAMYVCPHTGTVGKISVLPSVCQMVEWLSGNIGKGRRCAHVYLVSFTGLAAFKKVETYLPRNLFPLHTGADGQ